jgi:hypothetical protein
MWAIGMNIWCSTRGHSQRAGASVCKCCGVTDTVLAIDLGTGGPKVALVGIDGRTFGWRSAPVATLFVADGGAEQDPNEMWSAVVAATRALLTEVDAPAPSAIAVTSQYMSTVPIDASGRPTGPCILWMDHRGAAHSRSLLDRDSYALFVERHGMVPLPSGHDNVAHAHVLRTFHPAAFDAATALVEPMDYLTARLTGRGVGHAVHGVRPAGVRQPHVGCHRVRPHPRRCEPIRCIEAGAAGADEQRGRRGDRGGGRRAGPRPRTCR